MKPWQTLLNNAPNKGGKPKQRERERERERGRTQVLGRSTKTHRPSQRGKGTTSYVSEPPPVSRSISEKKREGNLQAQDCSCDRSSLWKAIGMSPVTTVAFYCITAMG